MLAPWQSPVPNTMKEDKSDPSQDLDAGWDDIASDVMELAAKPAGGDNPLPVDELDAGWDLVERSSTRDAAGSTDSGDSVRNRSKGAAQPEPAVTPARALSKKARRELDRQTRLHAAKRRAEAKLKRKEQRSAHRQQGVAAQRPHPTDTAAHQVTDVKRKAGSKPKRDPKPSLISTAEQSSQPKRKPHPTHERRIAEPATAQVAVLPASADAKMLLPQQSAPAIRGKLLWVLLSVAAAGIMAIIAKWLSS
jgi:hypothetical protein